MESDANVAARQQRRQRVAEKPAADEKAAQLASDKRAGQGSLLAAEPHSQQWQHRHQQAGSLSVPPFHTAGLYESALEFVKALDCVKMVRR